FVRLFVVHICVAQCHVGGLLAVLPCDGTSQRTHLLDGVPGTLSLLLTIFCIEMRQHYATLLQYFNGKQFDSISFAQYRLEFIQTLELFFATNQMYSKLFLGCLLVVYPLNAMMMTSFVHGQVDFAKRILMAMLITYEFIL